MKLYEIVNSINDAVYVGITRNSDHRYRWRSHKFAVKRGDITPLYCMMRKYGTDKFKMVVLKAFPTESDLLQAEHELISLYRNTSRNCLNILNGGESYFPIRDKQAWSKKLKEARKGRTPAKGMKHSDENKKIFSECGKRRWDICGRYSLDIINMSFKEANKLHGISRTHYYRLRKLGENNELT